MGGGSERRNADGRLDHGGRWRTASDWPLPQTEWTKLYLHSDRSLGREMPDDGARPLDYVSDPQNPVPTIGGALSSGEPVMRSGAYDQREFAERADVLAFSTSPLERDLEVTGPVTARLWIASDSPDTDFTAKLIDVHPPNKDYPSGFAMNLTEGILRCRYRDSWEQPSPMVSERTPTTKTAIPTHPSNFPTARSRLTATTSMGCSLKRCDRATTSSTAPTIRSVA